MSEAPKEEPRKMRSYRLEPATIAALEKKAKEMNVSEANALGVILGANPQSAYAPTDRRGKLVVR